jgi:PIN domain nuclease of toxin-antitoxin system
LLDTHVLIWYLTRPERLDPPAFRAISDPAHDVFVSVASLWEMAIKASLGKLAIPPNLSKTIEESHFTVLPVEEAHAWAILGLPSIHKDPFDRLLVAQATHEGLTLVTRDPHILAYPVATLSA